MKRRDFLASGLVIPAGDINFKSFEAPKGDIIFFSEGKEIVRFSHNGDIYVHEKLIENDKQLVDGLREWLANTCPR